MGMTRRTFLASGLTVAAATALPSSPLAVASDAHAVRVALLTGEPSRRLDVVQVFDELGLTVDPVSAPALAAINTTPHALLWIASATYPDPTELSTAELALIDKFLDAGKGVFIEFAANFPTVAPAGPIRRGEVARLFVAEAAPFIDALPQGAVLDPHNAVCIPYPETESVRAVVKIGKIAGVEKIDSTIPPKEVMPAVLVGSRGTGKFAVAATSISEFARRQYAPQAHWKKLLRDLTLTLLPDADRQSVLAKYIPLEVHSEPRRWVEPNAPIQLIAQTAPGSQLTLDAHGKQAWKETAPGKFEAPCHAPPAGESTLNIRARRGQASRAVAVPLRVEDRQRAYRRTLDNNLRWFEESGVLLRPDGSLGVAEWISGPDIEGNRIPFGKRQGYSPERADCVFESALAFWLYGKVAASDRHSSIGRNMLVNVMDFQRLDANDQYYGLWYTRGREGPIFQDDEGWTLIGALAGYRYTRQPMFLHRGRLALDATVKVFAQGAPRAAEAADPAHPRPSDRGAMIAAWLYAYGMTGERSTLDLALTALRDLIKSFPEIRGRVPARTGESTRFLLPLALACAYSSDPEFPRALHEQAEYLVSRMVPCGAIQEEGVYTGSKVQGGDLSLIHDSSEPISDQLYTTSFAAMNFWVAYKATGDVFYREQFFRVMDFLVRIQIESSDRPINGAWMRGFDYSLWEYYGSNADQSWTAYCLETGWDNAIIDLALELYLLDDSFFEVRAPV